MLNLTWDDVHTIKKVGRLDTDKHKTGRLYDVTLKIEDDQHSWLKRLRKQYIKEFQTHSELVFPTTSNTVDHSMSRTIRSVLTDLFGEKLDKDFHANSVRKMWDTHFYKNRESLGSAAFTSHLEQTGHTAETALRSYVVPENKINALNIYLSALSNLDESTTETKSTESISSSIASPSCSSSNFGKTTPHIRKTTPHSRRATPHSRNTTPSDPLSLQFSMDQTPDKLVPIKVVDGKINE